jgi:hypothetical protein
MSQNERDDRGNLAAIGDVFGAEAAGQERLLDRYLACDADGEQRERDQARDVAAPKDRSGVTTRMSVPAPRSSACVARSRWLSRTSVRAVPNERTSHQPAKTSHGAAKSRAHMD